MSKTTNRALLAASATAVCLMLSGCVPIGIPGLGGPPTTAPPTTSQAAPPSIDTEEPTDIQDPTEDPTDIQDPTQDPSTDEPTDEPTTDEPTDEPTTQAPSGDYYGAIALAYRGGAVGWAYNYPTRAKAEAAAMTQCKKYSNYDSTCHKIAWVRNGCLALALRWSGSNPTRYGWAVRSTASAAKAAAIKECGKNCKYRAHTCTSK